MGLRILKIRKKWIKVSSCMNENQQFREIIKGKEGREGGRGKERGKIRTLGLRPGDPKHR